MSSNSEKKPNRRGGKKRRGDNRRRSTASQTKTELYLPPTIPEREYAPCPICGEKITTISTALVDPTTERPVHFECVLKEIEVKENLATDEKVCYIGQGSFGIIKKKGSFEILRRVQYETKEANAEWRKELSPGLSRYDWPPEVSEENITEENVTENTPKENTGTENTTSKW
jgi:hypothetical protein